MTEINPYSNIQKVNLHFPFQQQKSGCLYNTSSVSVIGNEYQIVKYGNDDVLGEFFVLRVLDQYGDSRVIEQHKFLFNVQVSFASHASQFWELAADQFIDHSYEQIQTCRYGFH